MKKGFTLVEVTIVILIIGLLVVASVEGLSLIESVRLRKEATKMKNIINSAYIYNSMNNSPKVLFKDNNSFIDATQMMNSMGLSLDDFKSTLDNFYYSPAYISDAFDYYRYLKGYRTGSTYENRVKQSALPGILTVTSLDEKKIKVAYLNVYNYCKLETILDDRNMYTGLLRFYNLEDMPIAPNYDNCKASRNTFDRAYAMTLR